MKEAELYRKMPGSAVSCILCQRRCYLKDGETGFCHVRKNDGGVLRTLNFGKCASYAVDPIEKKPFYHFCPGSPVFSFAAPGCNYRCQHCQNWTISQPKIIMGQDIPPEGLVEMALRSHSEGIAYTYTEPTIFYEYAHETAKLARKKGLYNVFVSNGYMTQEATKEMGWLDAARVDLKAFDDKFYKEVCGGAHLEPVLKSIGLLHKKMHVEIITLLIPTLNDSDEEIRALSKWVRKLGADVPLHFTGYYPANRMTIRPTPVETLDKAREIAMEEGLDYVYTGNRPGDEGESTYCQKCKANVIERRGFEVVANRLAKGGKCPECKKKIPVVLDWKKARKD